MFLSRDFGFVDVLVDGCCREAEFLCDLSVAEVVLPEFIWIIMSKLDFTCWYTPSGYGFEVDAPLSDLEGYPTFKIVMRSASMSSNIE